MPNALLPLSEQSLTPDEVAALDKRRDNGLTLLVVAGQFSVISVVLCLWVGQDLTYSPGWMHPIAYYLALSIGIVVVAGGYGAYLRRGAPKLE